MRAKVINEENLFKGKSEEEILQIINETGNAPATWVAKVVNSQKGSFISVNFTGAWDRYGPIKRAMVKPVNVGKGFEDAVLVTSDHGTFIYLPGYQVENMPSNKEMFLFYADDAIFIKDLHI